MAKKKPAKSAYVDSGTCLMMINTSRWYIKSAVWNVLLVKYRNEMDQILFHDISQRRLWIMDNVCRGSPL